VSPVPQPRTPQFSLRLKLAAAAMAAVVACGLCEIAARIAFPAPPDPAREPQILYQSDPDVGFLHVPNQRGWLDDGLATINSLGLRGELPVMPKPAGSIRILAIGDSTTFGWGVNDDGTYCVQLERLLRAAYPHQPLSVVNGGVGAFDLKHDALLLRHFAPTLQPDIVLVGLYWNDLPYEASPPDGPAPSAPVASTLPMSAPPATGAPSKPFRIGNNPSRLNRMLRRSRVLYVLRQAWLRAMAPTGAASNLVRWEVAVLEGHHSPAIDAGWKDLEGTLEEIKAMGEAGGFAVGVVVMPIRAQVEGSYPHAEYQTRVRAMAKPLGLFVVDPLPLFAQQPDHAGLFIPYDRIHFTARGNAQVAEAAFDALEARPEFHRTASQQ
jgi:lysophospholipase L1-like esterase